MLQARSFILAIALLFFVTVPPPARAQATDGHPPLFVNLTTDDAWRANMALSFARNAQNAGHPVTVFLNVTAVRLASTAIPQTVDPISGKSAQQLLSEILDQGGTVIVCPMCLSHAGVARDTLMDRAQVGSPALTLPALFRPGGQVLSF